jgi:hypothetical protein
VIADSRSPFSCYYAEILRAEGLNAFEVLDISSVDAAVLAAHDIALLGEISLSPSQVALLSQWVVSGGALVAMRPDERLAGLLGLNDTGGILGDGYFQVDTKAPPGKGIVGQVLQFHGPADLYTLAQAEAVATLLSSPTSQTENPAVTLRRVGRGRAAAFAFDLARSVVYTRQGNPAWAGQKHDRNLPPIRSDDLFYGGVPGGVQRDWVNPDRVAIPQADELQRLLANLILHMNRNRRPLPRFWYLPFGKKAVVVMTADNHRNTGGLESRLERHLSQDPHGCELEMWECVRSTTYVTPSEPLNDGGRYQKLGFDFGVHFDTACSDWTPSSLTLAYWSQLRQFHNRPQFAALAAPVTGRTHCVAWSDWATQPKVELRNGIRLDTNYYYWPPEWVADRPGFFTGSGMPMRFADLDGSIIDVYQAVTQITDESGQTLPFTIDTLLDRAHGPEGFYGAITANLHSDSEDNGNSDQIVHSAQARGVPVVSARQMLTWLDGRNSSSFQAIQWNGSELSFEVVVGQGAIGLEAMLPACAGDEGRLAALTRDGISVEYERQLIKGVEYVVFPAAPGRYRAPYARSFDAGNAPR